MDDARFTTDIEIKLNFRIIASIPELKKMSYIDQGIFITIKSIH